MYIDVCESKFICTCVCASLFVFDPRKSVQDIMVEMSYQFIVLFVCVRFQTETPINTITTNYTIEKIRSLILYNTAAAITILRSNKNPHCAVEALSRTLPRAENAVDTCCANCSRIDISSSQINSSFF